MPVPAAREVTCFGPFEFDEKAGELRRNGVRVRLAQQPLQVLALLIENAGQIVTRERLHRHLWPSDVYVDFDHGLNKSIQKLRDALGDAADSPHYIETIPRTGYRFIAVPNQLPAPAQPTELEPASIPLPTIPDQVPDQAFAAPAQKPHRRKLLVWLIPLTAAALITLALLIHYQQRRASPIRSIAVLPLENLTGDPSQQYIVDGVTDELITMLAKNSNLRVISRTSAMQYKGVHRPLPDVARELDVDGIVEGSVARANNKLHVNLQLLRAASDQHIWAESYNRESNDLALLPFDAARAIAKQLNSAVSSSTSMRYINPEAHDAFIHGEYLWFSGEVMPAGDYYKKAVALQPDYAEAWAGISHFYGGAAIEGRMSPLTALPPMDAAAHKALELDNSLADAHLAASAAYFVCEHNWARALEEAARAIEIDPKSAEAYHWQAKVFLALNRNDDAIRSEKRASELNPVEKPWALALAYIQARQYDAAIQESLRKLEANERQPAIYDKLYRAYFGKGMYAKAVESMLKEYSLFGDSEAVSQIKKAYQKRGYRGVIEWQIAGQETPSGRPYLSPVDQARYYAQHGDRQKTLALLEAGLREQSPVLLWIQCDPSYDFLHTDPRYRSIIQQMGLPPAW